MDGAALLDALADAATRYVALPEHGAAIIALWVVHTHVSGASDITPRLAITSPTKRCGKSTLLRVLAKLVAKPLPSESATPSVLFRIIELARPTLLIDEADTFLTGSEELRGLVNSGHHRDGTFSRSVGNDFEPRCFSTWAPAAIACIGRLHGTIEDRSITIAMRRRRRDEPIERFRSDRCDDLKLLGRKAARWAPDQLVALTATDPEVPVVLHDRQADNWRPLIAIADQAGGDWPKRARAAAVASAGDAAGDDEAAGVELLVDIKKIFDTHYNMETDRISSAELIRHLTALEDRRWCEWKHGKPMTVRQLARLLAPYGIAPTTIRVGETTPKGYLREAFTDAFARYLLSDPQHRNKPQETADVRGFRSATSDLNVADEKCPKATESPTCCGVADEIGAGEEVGAGSIVSSPASNRPAKGSDEMPEIPGFLDRRPKTEPAQSDMEVEWTG